MKHYPQDRRSHFHECALGIMVAVQLCIGSTELRAEPTAIQVDAIPLSVTVERIASDQGFVSLNVSNTGTKPITAWAFQVTLRGSNGQSVTFRSEEDGYLYTDVRTLLDAGVSRNVRIGLVQGILVSDVDIRPLAVVFTDTTAAGNAGAADFILARRANERDELSRWVTTLKTLVIENARGARLPNGGNVSALSPDQRRAIRLDAVAAPLNVPDKVRVIDQLASLVDDAKRTRVSDKLKDGLRGLRSSSSIHQDERIQAFLRLLEIEHSNAVRHTRRP